MKGRIVVGVDPGGRYTGVVTRIGAELTAGCVLTRTTGLDLPDGTYITEVLDEIARQIRSVPLTPFDETELAVESLHEPSPHMGMTSVLGLIGTAMVLGAVLGRWPDAICIPPGGNGSAPDVAYPPAIRRYKRLGGPSIHARSAYDVAGAARFYRHHPAGGSS